MNSKKFILNLLVLCAFATAAFGQVGTTPTISARGSDGKLYTARSLTGGKPVLLVFFAAGCPHNPHGIKDMNRLSALLKGKVRVAGMTNLDAKQTRIFAHKYGAKFPMLSDVTGKTVAKLGAMASLDNLLLLPDGKVAKTWNGYNQSTLKQLERVLREQGGPSLSLNLSGFPKDRQSGCAFGMMDMH